MKRTLLIFLIITMVGGAGFGGWKYWQTQKTNTTQKDPTEGGKYLVIKEWGVRFGVPDDLRGDLSYIYDDRFDRVDVFSKRFQQSGISCYEVYRGSGPIIYLVREIEDWQIEGTGTIAFKDIAKTRYYYSKESDCETAVLKSSEGLPYSRLIIDVKNSMKNTLEEVKIQ